MPEFYMIFARKIFLCPSISYAYGIKIEMPKVLREEEMGGVTLSHMTRICRSIVSFPIAVQS